MGMMEGQEMHTRVDIKRNDTVKVIAGRDKGKQGRVLRVLPAKGRVLVEHVMMGKKSVRPNPQRNIKGGIAEQESAIAISNVMIVCPTCGPSRIGHDKTGDKRIRICRKCNAPLDK
jgi:large subunit ribosomal protein L24